MAAESEQQAGVIQAQASRGEKDGLAPLLAEGRPYGVPLVQQASVKCLQRLFGTGNGVPDALG